MAAGPDDFEAKARAFLQQQNFAPIEVKPGTRFQRDFDEQWLKWAERAFVIPFGKRASRWPAHESEAVDFVRQALRFRQTSTHPDPAVTPASLLARGEALLKANVDDPLIIMLTGWADEVASPGWPPPTLKFERAAKSPALKGLPPSVRLLILSNWYDVTKQYGLAYHEEQEQVDAALQCIEDPSTFGLDDDEVMAHMLKFLFSSKFLNGQEEKVNAICELPHLSEWAYNYLKGRYEEALALRSPDRGTPLNAASANSIAFHSHSAKAREHLVKAWQLRPDRSDPAASMIFVTNSGGGTKEDTARLWFDRAVAAQFDNMTAYRGLLISCWPSYGGSVEKIKALGLACVLTDRPDTNVPEYLHAAMSRLVIEHNGWRIPYRDDLLTQALLRVGEGQIANPARAWERPRLLGDQAVRAWACGEFARATETLKELNAPFHSRSRVLGLSFQMSESDIRDECTIHAAGKYEQWFSANDAYLSKDLDRADRELALTANAFPGEVPHLLAGRMAAVRSEKALAGGDWVRMNVTPGLEDWTINKGHWEGTPDGVLVNHGAGESAFIRYNARVGPNLEIRGEYEVVSPANRGQGLGVVVGYGRVGTTGEDYLLCQQLRFKSYCEAAILRRYYRTDEPFMNIGPPASKWTFAIRYENGLVSYTLNDRVILKDHITRMRGSPVAPIMKDGQVGFAHHTFENKNLTRVLKAEVRRLP